MDVKSFWQILVLAFLLEAVVQTLKPIWEPAKRTPDFFIALGTGLALSVGINYLAGLDLFAWLGVPLAKLPVVGVILTGILLSRGANGLHDLLKAVSLLKVKMGS